MDAKEAALASWERFSETVMNIFTGTGMITYLLIIVVLFRNRNKDPLAKTFYRMATSLGMNDIVG